MLIRTIITPSNCTGEKESLKPLVGLSALQLLVAELVELLGREQRCSSRRGVQDDGVGEQGFICPTYKVSNEVVDDEFRTPLQHPGDRDGVAPSNG